LDAAIGTDDGLLAAHGTLDAVHLWPWSVLCEKQQLRVDDGLGAAATHGVPADKHHGVDGPLQAEGALCGHKTL